MRRLIVSVFTLLNALCGNSLFAQQASPQETAQRRAKVDSLLVELPPQKDDTNKVKLLLVLSRTYYLINASESQKYGQQGLELATKLDWQKGVANANNNLGNIFTWDSNPVKALEYYSAAYKINEKMGSDDGIAETARQIGNIYCQQGKNAKGLEYYFKSLKIYEKQGFRMGIAGMSGNIANVYMENNDLPKALEYTLKAVKGFEEMEMKGPLAGFILNLGNTYYAMNDYPNAIIYLRKALKLGEETGNKGVVANALGNIGTVYDEMGEHAAAIVYLQKGVKADEELGEKRQLVYALHELGMAYWRLATDTSKSTKKAPLNDEQLTAEAFRTIPTDRRTRLQLSIKYSQQSLALAKEMDNVGMAEAIYRALHSAYSLTGEYKLALESYEHFVAIKDSIFTKENDKSIMEQGVKYEYEKKEAAAKAEQDKKDIRERLVRNAILTGLAGLLIFSIVVMRQRNRVKKEKARSEELLLNILPEEVAEELKEKGSAEAKLINEVTVLFTDFKGFTQLSEKLSPKELVGEINTCFSAFDNIMQKYGVEKIKTIGDAYMAAGGLPTPNKTHAEDVVKAALEIQAFMRRHKEEREAAGQLYFEIRIGVHTGPVVAGIVGIKKFAYDIWGDTVNTASRMESSGMVGKVNISETTYELVKDKFSCEYRGEVEAKGKGVMKMYFVG
ncbi:MAG: tetratricopeptide repeat protein [Taibaiella sp.]|nr:tetratricopeptide repeat protein [Taibaiella sp.]